LTQPAAFGIGTFLSNDFRKASDPDQVSKPLNIVIKLNKINGKDAVKLSDVFMLMRQSQLFLDSLDLLNVTSVLMRQCRKTSRLAN
jgi:nicotinic acid phosphoribosyltransferase